MWSKIAEVQRAFAVADVQKVTANLRIYGCGIPLAVLRNLQLRN